MKLQFRKMVIHDFKDYRGKHVLDLDALGLGVQYLRGENKVDALGSNGAGKTSLWDAFLWCLTGRTTRGMRGTDVRTWGGSENARVAVYFDTDDEQHVVKRSTKKNGLWLDKEQTTQEAIDRAIGLNVVSIPHTILLGQKRDLFFDLQAAKKLEILSETLNLDKWEERSKRAKDKVKECDVRYAEVQAVLTTLEKERDGLFESLEDIERQSRQWEDERSQGGEQREKHMRGLLKSREAAVNEMGQYDLAYDGAETELRAVRRDLLKKREEMDEITDKLYKTKAARALARDEVERLKELAESDVCPTCGQPVAKKHAHAKDAKEKLRAAKKVAAVASDRVIVRETQKELLQKVIDRMRASEKDFAEKSDNAKDKLDHLKAHIADIDKQVAVLKAQDRSDETNPYLAQVHRARKLIKNAKAGIREAKEVSDLVQRKRTRIEYWVNGFKQVRLYLLESFLDELTEVTQNLLPDVGLAGWAVQYDIEREKKDGSLSTGLNVRILKPGMTKTVKWEAWSGGENQRLLIVGAIALSEVLLRHAGIECDLLVLDEPTRHMSREGVADLVDYLVDLGRGKQVFYADHAVVESNRFANVLTVTKDANGSRFN